MFEQRFEKDAFPTALGLLNIYFLGHGSLMMELADRFIIHVDPFSRVADYAALPQADLILITHEHRDHLDPAALKNAAREHTTTIVTERCAAQLAGGRVLKNGETADVNGIHIEAVPAYNLVHKRENGEPFHPKGHGNGYVLTFGDLRLYIAGDTEDIPEMAALKDIHIAFLPMNLPYTMTPQMAAAAARSFMPRILYPYHYSNTDPQELVKLLADSGIEVRIRKLA
jgi:L-ascorbate metabolism protein UlaG (beta-lactamase superfamily)